LAERLVRVLEGAVAAPERAIGSLEILAPSERNTILREWNATARAVPAVTVPALFAAQARSTPGATALVFGDTRLSYLELECRANQLAHHLRRFGVGPETVVGLCVERSAAMVVGLLGILKAGCAYLPLDPAYPAERLAFMLGDAGAAVLVTQADLRERIPADGAHVVCLDDDAAIARQPVTAPRLGLDPHHPAYVIYTSGSTGTPKGVVVSHGALSNFLLAMQEQVQLSPDDRLMAVTTIGFEIAALELFLPLIGGAGLALASRDVVRDPSALLRTIEQTGSTVVQATPTLWQALTAQGGDDLHDLRMLVGGEALSARLAATLRQH